MGLKGNIRGQCGAKIESSPFEIDSTSPNIVEKDVVYKLLSGKITSDGLTKQTSVQKNFPTPSTNTLNWKDWCFVSTSRKLVAYVGSAGTLIVNLVGIDDEGVVTPTLSTVNIANDGTLASIEMVTETIAMVTSNLSTSLYYAMISVVGDVLTVVKANALFTSLSADSYAGGTVIRLTDTVNLMIKFDNEVTTCYFFTVNGTTYAAEQITTVALGTRAFVGTLFGIQAIKLYGNYYAFLFNASTSCLTEVFEIDPIGYSINSIDSLLSDGGDNSGWQAIGLLDDVDGRFYNAVYNGATCNVASLYFNGTALSLTFGFNTGGGYEGAIFGRFWGRYFIAALWEATEDDVTSVVYELLDDYTFSAAIETLIIDPSNTNADDMIIVNFEEVKSAYVITSTAECYVVKYTEALEKFGRALSDGVPAEVIEVDIF